MRISDWSSDVCSSDLDHRAVRKGGARPVGDALAHQCDGCGPCNARGASGHAWAPGRTHRQYREHGVAEGLCLYERLYGLEACGSRGDPRPGARAEIGRAHVRNPVTTAHIVSLLVLV